MKQKCFSEVAMVQYVVCRLIRRKILGSYPRSVIKNEIRKIFLRRVPLSRFLAKTLRVNKPAMKNFFKILLFGGNIKLQVPPLTYKINAHNMSGVRNQAVILTEGLLWRIMYVCIHRKMLLIAVGISCGLEIFYSGNKNCYSYFKICS